MSDRFVARVGAIVGVVVVALVVGATGTTGGVGVERAQQDDARTITYGERVTSTLDRGDPKRLTAPALDDDRIGTWYQEPVRFEGSAGDLIDARLRASGTDTVLLLEAPDGETVVVNDDGGVRGNSRIVHRLRQNGTYTLHVTGRQPLTTSEYSLSLDRVVDQEPDPGRVNVGGTVVGRVDESDRSAEAAGGHHDNLTLAVRRGRSLRLKLDSPATSAVRLYGPTGDLIAADEGSVPGASASVGADLPYGGEYTVVVASEDDTAPFPYRLSVADASEVDRELSQELRYLRDRKKFNRTDIDWTALNTTTAYVGTPIEVRAAVTNTGTARGPLSWYLLADDTRIGYTEEAINISETEVVTFRGRIDEPGQHAIFIDSVPVGTVTAVPRPEADRSVQSTDTRTRVVVTNASAGSVFEVPLADPSNPNAVFERARFGLGTETRRLTVETGKPSTGDLDSVTAALPRGARALDRLRVETGRSVPPDPVANVTLAFEVAATAVEGGPRAVRLYGRNESGAWTPLNTTVAGISTWIYEYRATTDAFTEFVVAETRPVFERGSVSVRNRTITAGENVSVSVDVSNVGRRNGTETVPLFVDDRPIAADAATVQPGETATVSLEAPIHRPGTYEVWLGNGTEPFSVTVEEPVEPEPNTTTVARTPTTVPGVDEGTPTTAGTTPPRAAADSAPGTASEQSPPDRRVVGVGVVVLLLAAVGLWRGG